MIEVGRKVAQRKDELRGFRIAIVEIKTLERQTITRKETLDLLHLRIAICANDFNRTIVSLELRAAASSKDGDDMV